MKKIINQSAHILGVSIDDEAADEIAKRSRFTPRIANYLLKRCRDFAQVHRGKLSKETVREALMLLDIDELGLNALDRKILETIITKFAGGPVGLGTISAAISEEEGTIEEVSEPYLIQLGLLSVRRADVPPPTGRTATLGTISRESVRKNYYKTPCAITFSTPMMNFRLQTTHRTTRVLSNFQLPLRSWKFRSLVNEYAVFTSSRFAGFRTKIRHFVTKNYYAVGL